VPSERYLRALAERNAATVTAGGTAESRPARGVPAR